MKVRCLIVDDEPLAVDVIKNHLEKVDQLELVGTCKNAFEVYNYLQKKNVDLIFLDIHMPELKGTDLLKGLQNPPKVIFTTAYREYALEGFELNALDYLLKPISFERFMQAINKYFEQTNGEQDVTFHQSKRAEDSFIYVREKNMVHKILTRDILYIESLSDYVIIYYFNKKITVRNTMTAIEEMLPHNEFARIHRSYIINIQHINKFTAHSISINEKELPIGPSYSKEVFKMLNYNNFM
jgi:two-component system, LytTR family, response regulator